MSTKESVLALLESGRGQSLSGAVIARQLGVTRNAVWKAVKELEKEGYAIQAVPNKGYCLCEENDILSVQGILPFLREKELAGKIFVYPSLESTNKTAKEMAIAGAGHGTVVIADSQTAGKGRYGRGFFAPPGRGVYMSLILKPLRRWLEVPTLVTAFAAVSVCRAIEAATGKQPQIKWVNDLYLAGKKICGILTQAVTDFESGGIQWIVVGVGVNLSIPEREFPPELRPIAGSIFPEGNPTAARNRLAAEIANNLLTLEGDDGRQAILTEYKKRLMMLGESVAVTTPRDSYQATAVDVDDTGRLIVRKKDGQTLALSAGEISIRLQPESSTGFR